MKKYGDKPNVKSNELVTYPGLIRAVVGSVGGFDGLNKVATEIGLLNNGQGASMIEVAVPFLTHTLVMLKEHPELRESKPALIGLFGAIHHSFGVLVTHEQWQPGSLCISRALVKAKWPRSKNKTLC